MVKKKSNYRGVEWWFNIFRSLRRHYAAKAKDESDNEINPFHLPCSANSADDFDWYQRLYSIVYWPNYSLNSKHVRRATQQIARKNRPENWITPKKMTPHATNATALNGSYAATAIVGIETETQEGINGICYDRLIKWFRKGNVKEERTT